MTTDTSAEALEESIFWLKAKYRRHGEIEDRIAAEQLEYFQAEKRADPLDTRRPEVRDTLDWIEAEYPEASTIRTELLRLDALARELNEERGRQAALRFDERIRAEKAEAELAALKARIAEAPISTCGDVHAETMGGCDYCMLQAPPQLSGKRVRLLVEEPQDDNAKEGPEC